MGKSRIPTATLPQSLVTWLEKQAFEQGFDLFEMLWSREALKFEEPEEFSFYFFVFTVNKKLKMKRKLVLTIAETCSLFLIDSYFEFLFSPRYQEINCPKSIQSKESYQEDRQKGCPKEGQEGRQEASCQEVSQKISQEDQQKVSNMKIEWSMFTSFLSIKSNS